MNDIYAKLGVKRRINAAGTLTRLGGSLMAPEVLDAMREAAQCSVDIGELQSAASRIIGLMTGAEAGLVTSGASAALTLAAAACLAGYDIARMARLPDTREMPNEIVMPRTHRNAYDHALRAAGAVIVDIGHNDRGTSAGVRGIEAWEIEAAFGPRTAAFCFAATPETKHDLGLVVETCHRHGIPVIVDAAAQLPPRTNLQAFIAAGADLVVFSGGKAIGGPQSTGILAGKRDLVASALLQLLDMDVVPQRWTAPDFIDRAKVPVPPHHGIGRGFKVGKEEIAGLLVALKRFAATDDLERLRAVEARLAKIAAGLNGAEARIVADKVPTLEISVADAARALAQLAAHDPPVHVGERKAGAGILIVDLQAVRPEDDSLLIAALRVAVA
ncbi:MAG TPA: aminotransferase class V-fold PLP-dependent enzyme [Alphaproteobacteria bacterium]|nr:aminotransferase class V-fold PLP-dependent enzyme [Alphaproteobacteria bacterium]